MRHANEASTIRIQPFYISDADKTIPKLEDMPHASSIVSPQMLRESKHICCRMWYKNLTTEQRISRLKCQRLHNMTRNRRQREPTKEDKRSCGKTLCIWILLPWRTHSMHQRLYHIFQFLTTYFFSLKFI